MGIRIDNLDSTALFSRDHVIPAMKDGLTVKLTVAQILSLIESDDLELNPAGLAVLSATTAQLLLSQSDAALDARLTKSDNLSSLANKDTSLTNLGGNANGLDVFKNATSLGATLAKIANDTAGRAALLAPAAPKTGAGVGQWTVLLSATGTAISLPAGGTWAYFWLAFNVTTNIFASNGLQVGFAAGGSLINSGIANAQVSAVAWRIA